METTSVTRTAQMTGFLRWLRAHSACDEGVKLVSQHATPAEWWAASERGDHMLWLAGRAGIDRPALVLAACACARLALPHVRAGEDQPRITIETAEAWARGDVGVTSERVYTAYVDACTVIHTKARIGTDGVTCAAAYAAAYAAYAAVARVTHNSEYANCVSAAAAYAADAATRAAAYAADIQTRALPEYVTQTRVLSECADLVRARIPWSVIEKALSKEGA